MQASNSDDVHSLGNNPNEDKIVLTLTKAIEENKIEEFEEEPRQFDYYKDDLSNDLDKVKQNVLVYDEW